MKWLKNIFREVFGLFVDDGSFALAILLWLAVVRWATPHLNIPAGITAVILFVGLALILAESATRYSRRKQ
ncbi:MAG TPA: hypothetical protein VNX17_01940 [Edaphobacter sp.]|jgi:hypothetical protein|nr:hypothetical protein [Edaphobacter sp.]